MYNFAIDYWATAKVGVKNSFLHQFVLSRLALIRLRVNSISTIIARRNEIINDMEPCDKKEEYIELINNYIDMMPSFSKIQSLVEMTKNEKRQKIKNCLAHSNFKIVELDDEKNYEILIENEFVRGRVTLEELDGLRRLYTTIADDLGNFDLIFGNMRPLLELKSNNAECLRNAIKKIRVIKPNVNIYNNFTIFNLDLPEGKDCSPLSEESINIIENFIKYIGIDVWISLSQQARAGIFGRHIKFIISNKVDFRNSEEYILAPASFMLTNDNIDRFIEMETLKLEAPCAYVSSILDFGYFCFNYLREANKKEKIVEFHDVNLNIANCFCKYETPIKYVDESIYFNRLLDEANNKKSKIIASIEKKEKTKKGLNMSTTVSEEKRNKLISDLNNILKTRYESLKEIEFDIKNINDNLKNARKYNDSSSFFRHLRNSFSHGFYEVDYNKALRTKRLEDIVFTFRDYDIDSEDRNNRTIVFEYKITAKKLVKLLNEFSTLIDNSVNKNGVTTAVYIGSTNKKLEERVSKIEQEYISKNIKVFRKDKI